MAAKATVTTTVVARPDARRSPPSVRSAECPESQELGGEIHVAEGGRPMVAAPDEPEGIEPHGLEQDDGGRRPTRSG